MDMSSFNGVVINLCALRGAGAVAWSSVLIPSLESCWMLLLLTRPLLSLLLLLVPGFGGGVG